MKFKLISTDIDDTLVPCGRPFADDYVVQKLRELQQKGIYVVPNTGRGIHNLPKNISKANIQYAICANGSKVYDLQKEKVIYDASIDYKLAASIFKELKELKVPFFCFAEKGAYADTYIRDHLLNYALHKDLADMLITYDNLMETFYDNQMPVQKIIAIFLEDTPIKREQVVTIIKEKFPSIATCHSNTFNLEINNKKANKQVGLKTLCDYLNIDLSEVIVCGDNDNDIPVLSMGCFNLVPENGTDNAKKYANVITESCENNGIVKYLHQLLKEASHQ